MQTEGPGTQVGAGTHTSPSLQLHLSATVSRYFVEFLRPVLNGVPLTCKIAYRLPAPLYIYMIEHILKLTPVVSL